MLDPTADPEAVLGARRAVLEVAARFTSLAGPILTETLDARLNALLASMEPDLGADVLTTLPRAAESAIRTSVRATIDRLEDPDVWLSPHTRLEPTHRGGWTLGALDDPSNRVWIALTGAARGLDPLLEEFGLPAPPRPGRGGGRFGLQPRTLPQLDPSARLARLWREYRSAYERYRGLLEATV